MRYYKYERRMKIFARIEKNLHLFLWLLLPILFTLVETGWQETFYYAAEFNVPVGPLLAALNHCPKNGKETHVHFQWGAPERIYFLCAIGCNSRVICWAYRTCFSTKKTLVFGKICLHKRGIGIRTLQLIAKLINCATVCALELILQYNCLYKKE